MDKFIQKIYQSKHTFGQQGRLRTAGFLISKICGLSISSYWAAGINISPKSGTKQLGNRTALLVEDFEQRGATSENIKSFMQIA